MPTLRVLKSMTRWRVSPAIAIDDNAEVKTSSAVSARCLNSLGIMVLLGCGACDRLCALFGGTQCKPIEPVRQRLFSLPECGFSLIRTNHMVVAFDRITITVADLATACNELKVLT